MGAPPGFKFEPALPVTRGDVRFSIEFKDWDGDGNHMHSLAVFGWCVSKTGAARAIEFYLHGTPIASAQLHIERPDVVDLLGATDTPLICGFHLRFSKLTLPAGARLELQLWEARERARAERVLLGTLSGLPGGQLAARYRERYHPLSLLGMGRSGTTYLMQLLSSHPDILVPGPHPYEMRQPVWLWHAAHVLSAPAATTSMHPDGFEAHDAERLGYNPYRSRDWEKIAAGDGVMRWQEEVLPLEAVDFCKRQVDEFADSCCEGRSPAPRYVAQKMSISPTRYLVRNIYTGAREIFLVRDFRDVWLSARSFNHKRGVASFERGNFANDLAWMRGLAFSSRQIRLAHMAAGDQAQLVHFEELMRAPQQTLMRILVQLGIEASAERVQAILASASSSEGSGVLSHRTSQASQTGPRWPTEMNPEEKAVAAEVFGEDLRYFGYQT